MDKIIVVVFDDETKAFEGSQILREMDNEGEISVYEAQVVAKEPGGRVRFVHNAHVSGFPMFAGCTTVGALIGLLGGPPGVVVGATTGALVGSIGEVEETGMPDEFVTDVATLLTPGKAAVVADIAEDYPAALDTRMQQIGGVVFRHTRTPVDTTPEDRDAAAHQAEMEQLQAKRAQARADRLTKIDARIDHLRVKEDVIERRRVKMQLRQQEREAKIRALETKAARPEGAVRRRQEARIAELRRDYAEKAAESRT